MTTLLLFAMLQVPPQADTVTLGSIISITPAPVSVVVSDNDTTYIYHDSGVTLDSAAMVALIQQARADGAASVMGEQERRPWWDRVAWIGIGIAGAWVLGHGLNKIARAIRPDNVNVDVDVDVEGDEADQIIINVPPPAPPPPPSKPPWGRGKGQGPG